MSTRTDPLFPYTTLFRSLGFTIALVKNAFGRLMSLIEHARDSAALPPDRSETVVPIGLANGTISDHGKHPVESREALAFGDNLFRSEESRGGNECVSTCRSRW